MRSNSLYVVSLLLPALATAHFQLLSPPARGYDEDVLAQYPCGGQNTVQSSNRTQFPMAGGPIQLNMEHDRVAMQVMLSLGNEGSNFNISLEPLFIEEGIGKFCTNGIVIPSNAGITDGMNGTIQVVTNGDPSGGLYNCADITFSSSAKAGQCNNGTGIMAMPYQGTATSANSTNPEESGSTSASGSPTASASAGGHSGAAAPGALPAASFTILGTSMIVVLASGFLGGGAYFML